MSRRRASCADACPRRIQVSPFWMAESSLLSLPSSSLDFARVVQGLVQTTMNQISSSLRALGSTGRGPDSCHRKDKAGNGRVPMSRKLVHGQACHALQFRDSRGKLYLQKKIWTHQSGRLHVAISLSESPDRIIRLQSAPVSAVSSHCRFSASRLCLFSKCSGSGDQQVRRWIGLTLQCRVWTSRTTLGSSECGRCKAFSRLW